MGDCRPLAVTPELAPVRKPNSPSTSADSLHSTTAYQVPERGVSAAEGLHWPLWGVGRLSTGCEGRRVPP